MAERQRGARGHSAVPQARVTTASSSYQPSRSRSASESPGRRGGCIVPRDQRAPRARRRPELPPLRTQVGLSGPRAIPRAPIGSVRRRRSGAALDARDTATRRAIRRSASRRDPPDAGAIWRRRRGQGQARRTRHGRLRRMRRGPPARLKRRRRRRGPRAMGALPPRAPRSGRYRGEPREGADADASPLERSDEVLQAVVARVAGRCGGGAVLYGAVRLSPLPFKPTLTITLFVFVLRRAWCSTACPDRRWASGATCSRSCAGAPRREHYRAPDAPAPGRAAACSSTRSRSPLDDDERRDGGLRRQHRDTAPRHAPATETRREHAQRTATRARRGSRRGHEPRSPRRTASAGRR